MAETFGAGEVGETGLTGQMAEEILAGLSMAQKQIPAKYLYDARGSALFEQITGLPEYYLTRAERRILRARAAIVAEIVGAGAAIVEFGSAGAAKAKILLEAMDEPSAYVPLDVSVAALEGNARAMRQAFPALSVRPVCADFTGLLPRVLEGHGGPRLLLFLGSSIGNFTPPQATRLLGNWRRSFPGAIMLVGVDLDKDPARLLAAYDDDQGVTAAFNRNLLLHLNAALAADFDPAAFAHRARYRKDPARVEMHLESLRGQTVTVAGRRLTFRAGETIHTESSHKHTVDSFTSLAEAAGWRPVDVWLDQDGQFSLHVLADGGGGAPAAAPRT